jgi:hypothetical protein
MSGAITVIDSLIPPAGTVLAPVPTAFTVNATASVAPAAGQSYSFQLVISSGETGYISPPTVLAPGQTQALPPATLLITPQPPSIVVGIEVLAAAVGGGNGQVLGVQNNKYPVS